MCKQARPFLSLNHLLSTVLKDKMNAVLKSVTFTLNCEGFSQYLTQEAVFTHQGQNSYTKKNTLKRWYFRNLIKWIFSIGIWDVIKQGLVHLFCYVSFVNRRGNFFPLFWPPSFFISLYYTWSPDRGYCLYLGFFENSARAKIFWLYWSQRAWFVGTSVPLPHILSFIHQKLQLGEKII